MVGVSTCVVGLMGGSPPGSSTQPGERRLADDEISPREWSAWVSSEPKLDLDPWTAASQILMMALPTPLTGFFRPRLPLFRRPAQTACCWQLSFDQLFTWPADQPRHATPTPVQPVNTDRPLASKTPCQDSRGLDPVRRRRRTRCASATAVPSGVGNSRSLVSRVQPEITPR